MLVTGSNGYIASNIVDLLLEQGYNVRGTVRTERPWLNKYFDDKYGKGRFETKIVVALNDDGAFDEVVKGVAGIIHVVRPKSFSHRDSLRAEFSLTRQVADITFNQDPDAVIPWVIAGTVNLLKAAASQPSVKSVVLTSSSSAAYIPEANKEGVIDESRQTGQSLNFSRAVLIALHRYLE